MPLRQLDPDELHGGFLVIVSKGFHDVGTLCGVNHAEPAGNGGQKRPLNPDGEKHDNKNDVENIKVGHGGADDRHDGKNDGGGTAQAGPADKQLLPKAAAKRFQQQKYSDRPCRKGEEQRNTQRGNNDLRHLGRRTQQTEQEEQHDLHHTG